MNGRNYTDLALLQPGVVAYPHRDGGSVVAHGVGTSINGQDPRSNVYLLDGTPQNDFTNGPAGSAAGTSLGIETIREFRVETNAYSAEFGRNFGGQINAVTKSGTNELPRLALRVPPQRQPRRAQLLRPPSREARVPTQPVRRQPSAAPSATTASSSSAATSRCARTSGARLDGRRPTRQRAGTGQSARADPSDHVGPAVRPYLDEFPLPNGTRLGGGLAAYNFGFDQQVRQHFFQGRIDYNRSERDQFFARYTFDDADQLLPTDFPQFPRTFLSRNQFFTGEYRQTLSASTLNTFRFNFSRTRVGQNVESNTTQTLQPFVPGRGLIGGIDIGGIPRFGPQTSANLRSSQNVFGGEYSLVHSRGRHLIKAGALAERYQDNMVNPTFSLGIFTFASPRTSSQPRAALHRHHARRRARPLLALHALRPLRAGHLPRAPRA